MYGRLIFYKMTQQIWLYLDILFMSNFYYVMCNVKWFLVFTLSF